MTNFELYRVLSGYLVRFLQIFPHKSLTIFVKKQSSNQVVGHMTVGHVLYSRNFPRCDKCKKEDSTTEIRPCDKIQCDSCWHEKDNEHEQY